MGLFHRKSTWQKVTGATTAYIVKNPAVRTGTAAVAGLLTATVASAAVSARRHKNDS
jgi:hypothetical protein